MIRLIDAEKIYDNGTHALNGVSFTVDDGEFAFLVGPSGSGKSTLTREVLFENLIGNLGSDPSKAKWKGCDIITGREPVARVLEVDQTPIGKSRDRVPPPTSASLTKPRALCRHE